MYLKLFVVFFLMLAPGLVVGQGASSLKTNMVTLPGGKKQKWERPWRTIGPGKDYGYIVGTTRDADGNRGADVVLYAIGDKLQEIKRVDLNSPWKGKSPSYASIQMSGDTIYLFSTLTDKKTDRSQLMVQRVAAATAREVGAPQQILTVDGADNKYGNHLTITSPQGQGQGFVIEYRVALSKKRMDVHFVVLDERLRFLQEHLIANINEEEYNKIRNVRASDTGNLYYFTSEEKGDRRRKPRLNDYFIHRISPDGVSTRQQIQLTENSEAAYPSLRLRSDGTLFATGKYFDKNAGEYAGLYFSVYDGQQLNSIRSEQLPVAMNEAGLITTSNQAGQLDKFSQKLFDAYTVNEVFFTDDGGTYVLGESPFTTESVSQAGTAIFSTAYRGLYVTRISPAGEPVFFRHIPIGVEVYNFPTGILLKDDLLITLYSDRKNMDNLDEPVKKVQDKLNRTLVRHIVVSRQGEVSSAGNRYYTEPVPMVRRLETDVAVQSPSGEAVYYYVYDGNRRKVVRVAYSE